MVSNSRNCVREIQNLCKYQVSIIAMVHIYIKTIILE